MLSVESRDLGMFEWLPAVKQQVGIWRLNKAVLYLSDGRVIEAVPGAGHSVVAESCVVTHVQMTCMVLQKKKRMCPA